MCQRQGSCICPLASTNRERPILEGEALDATELARVVVAGDHRSAGRTIERATIQLQVCGIVPALNVGK
jgi:hypothetical protein